MTGTDPDGREGGLPPRSSRRVAQPRKGRRPVGPLIGLCVLAAVLAGAYFGLPLLVAPRAEIRIDNSPSAVQERDKQVTQVQQKIEGIKKTLSQDPEATVKIQVSGAEANAYLAKTVSKVPQTGPVYPTAARVEIEQGSLAGDVSLMVAGKAVGVHVDLKPEISEDKVVLKVLEASLGGIPLPASFGPLAGVVGESLPSGVSFDPKTKGFVIDPSKLPFDLKDLDLEMGRLTATVGQKGP